MFHIVFAFGYLGCISFSNDSSTSVSIVLHFDKKNDEGFPHSAQEKALSLGLHDFQTIQDVLTYSIIICYTTIYI